MTHANRGRSLEDAVDAINEGYRLAGVASVDRVPTEWVVIGYDPVKFRARKVFPKRKSGVDYHGTLRAGGKPWPFYFDAKDTKIKTRFNFDNIHDHQLDFLREKSQLGAVTFILVRVAPLGRAFLVDVEAIERARRAGKASLSLAELEAGIECPMQGECPDYLPPLLKLLGEGA